MFTVSQFTTVNTNARAANNAKGGTIIVVMEDTFFLNGKLLANSGDNGDGGLIVINSAELNVTNGEIRASGNNGIINIFNGPENNRPFRFTKTSTDQERGVIAANGPIDGALSAGSISISNAKGEIIVDSAYALRANSSSTAGDEEPGTANNAPGGSISITSDSAKVTINGIVAANGSGTGRGGTIVLNIPELDVVDGQIRANGNEGIISIIDNSGGGAGSAGAFKFQKTGNLPEEGVVAANAQNGDSAGSIIVSNPVGDISILSDFAMRVNGTAGEVNAGNISISSATKKMTIAGVLRANASAIGTRGNISLVANEIDASGADIQCKSGATDNEMKGVSIQSKTLVDLSSKFKIDVSGTGGGDAGSIVILENADASGDSNIAIGSSGIVYELIANGGQSGGNGGLVRIESILRGVIRFANGAFGVSSKSEGDGGNISIEARSIKGTPDGVSTILAEGAGSGKGGTVNLRTTSALEDLEIGQENGNLSISVQSIGSGNAGEILLTASLASVVVNGTDLRAKGVQNNAEGGFIKIESGQTVGLTPTVKVNGLLDVQGVGAGKGGTIDITGLILGLEQCELNADGGSTGNGGNIVLTSTNEIDIAPGGLTLGGGNGPATLTARGGSSAGAGLVTLNVNENLIVNSGSSINVSSRPNTNGSAGRIIINTGLGSNSNNSSIFVGGLLAANATAASAAGNIDINMGSEIPNNRLSFGSSGAVSAIGGSGGVVTIRNTSVNPEIDTGLLIGAAGPALDPGTITAGLIELPNQSFSIESNVANLNGVIKTDCKNFKLTTSAVNDFVHDQINSENDIEINLIGSGNGAIQGINNSIMKAGNKLEISTTGGSFGSFTSRLKVDVASLKVTIAPNSQGSTFVENLSSSLTLQDEIVVGGSFDLVTAGDASIGDINAQAGSISLKSVSGNLLVRQRLASFGTLKAGNGNIVLQGGDSVTISANDKIEASGDILISNGSITSDPNCLQTTDAEPVCAPANVDGTITGSGAIYWGDQINAAPTLRVDANGRTVKIVGNGHDVNFQSNVIINTL